MLNRDKWVLLAAVFACTGCAQKAPVSNAPAPAPLPAAAVRADSGRATAAHKVYVCPMHADTTYDHPGNCARCGMVLVEKT